ncbi:MAG: Sec-independent protein translocase protein TatB [Emcibacteraceae bacterium]|nr:Sec-independent protein translocase protein TatB [Emcibacteraceae bacterium]MDG1725640.1 Sec-independent protein translocase protein TatB [Emcibacteraceae bacterium]
MFDVGFPELFIVAVLAIVVVGPKDLPKVIRSVMGMIRKVREMGSEFQAGVKKMADEVELDAVTRKLNEAGNVKIDDKSASSATAASDYDEFDYDEYDYEGHNYEPPAPKIEEKPADDDASTPASDDNDEVTEEVVASEDGPEVEENNTPDEPDEKIKSKTDD